MRLASASSTRNSIPDGWLITSPRVGTRPARVKTRPPTVSISAVAFVLGQDRTNLGFEILDRHAGVQVERAVGTFSDHRRLDIVVFVGDVAGDRFDEVLDRYQTVDAAVFVHHQRQMDALRPHLQQQVQHRKLRRHQQRLAQDRLEREGLGPADIGEHVLDVDHADHVVQLLPIDRQAGVAFVADQFDRLRRT